MTADLNINNLVVIFVAILFSMGFHEAMHGFTAHWLGDPTAAEEGRLTLNPLKHVDIVTTVLLPVAMIAMGLPPIFAAKPVPFNPFRVKYAEFGAALIGIAGPLTNLALAIVAAGIVKVLAISGGIGSPLVNALLIFIQVNIGFFVFNMIPIPPLDGSRLLYAVAPEPLQEVMAAIERAGIFVLFLVLILLMPVLGPILNSVNSEVLNILL